MGIYRLLLGFIFLGFLNACNQKKAVRQIPIHDFFATSEKNTYRVSPDGKRISYLSQENKEQCLFLRQIEDDDDKSERIFTTKSKNTLIYFWINNEELICFEKRFGHNIASLFIVNRNGTKRQLLSGNGKNVFKLLGDNLIDNDYLHVLSNQRDSTMMDVYRLNVRNGQMRMEIKNPGNFLNWITDNTGKLRIAISSDGVNETLWYRQTDQMPFKKMTTNNFETVIKPLAFVKDNPNVIYAISNANRDKNALVTLDCLTGKEKSTLFYNDSLNVVDAKFSAQKEKVAYVVYETWKKKKDYLNNDSKAIYQHIEKLLPQTEIFIASESAEENVLVLKTFTDKNPGAYYLYKTETQKLTKLADVNPAISEEEMCAVKPISYTARDGLKINGYLTLPKKGKKNMPVVIIPNKANFTRISWDFNTDVQFLANRGYAVLQVNYRGTPGYGKHFFSAGFKEWGAKVQNDIDDAATWLIKNEIANPHKIAIYGNAFGGQIALNGAIRGSLYRCVASNNGVLNTFSLLKSIPPFFKARLAMYYTMLGNPDTDTEYIRQISPVFHADKVKIPVLITQTIGNPWVNPNNATQFVRELKKRKVPVMYFEQSGLETNEKDGNKQEIYKELEKFLQTNLQ